MDFIHYTSWDSAEHWSEGLLGGLLVLSEEKGHHVLIEV